MFVFYSVHYPQPEKEELWVQQMRQFDELIKKQPPVLVKEVPSGEWEVKPPEVYMLNSAG